MRADTQCPKCGGNRGFLPGIDKDTGIPFVKFLCPTCSPTTERRGTTHPDAPPSSMCCPACGGKAYAVKLFSSDGKRSFSRVCRICGYKACGKPGRKPGAKAARGEGVGRKRKSSKRASTLPRKSVADSETAEAERRKQDRLRMIIEMGERKKNGGNPPQPPPSPSAGDTP